MYTTFYGLHALILREAHSILNMYHAITHVLFYESFYFFYIHLPFLWVVAIEIATSSFSFTSKFKSGKFPGSTPGDEDAGRADVSVQQVCRHVKETQSFR